VKSEPLTEYISRVLPSLDVTGTQVVTLEGWMRRTRKKVLPELKQKYAEDVPPAVARLKKHPAILSLLTAGVAREAEAIGRQLEEKASPSSREPVRQKWAGTSRYALLPRVREMGRWLDSNAAARAGVTDDDRRALGGTLRRARAAADDVYATWAELLTDRELLRAVLNEQSREPIPDEDIDELVRWVGAQADEAAPETAADDAPGDDDDEADSNVGVDGRDALDEGPRGRLDEHDDALLLELTQLKYGGLPIAGSQRTVTYEHVIVDEAQDLSPTDIAVLRGALTKRESMTLAGDTAQKLIFDNGFEDWQQMLSDVGIEGVKIDQLKVSYRSTRPIVEFSRHVLGPLADPEAPVVPRDGAPVEQFTFGSSGESLAFLGEALRSLVTRERRANVAVVARYAAQADMYHQGLQRAEVPSLRRVYGKEFSFQPGIDVVDVAQVKGLEYDYVVCVEVNQNTYPPVKEARHLLHIAATRAVHQLWVVSVAEPSPLLPDSIL
jgi:DNA helicase-2/ATP-dependent DNA helicase PcrA